MDPQELDPPYVPLPNSAGAGRPEAPRAPRGATRGLRDVLEGQAAALTGGGV